MLGRAFSYALSQSKGETSWASWEQFGILQKHSLRQDLHKKQTLEKPIPTPALWPRYRCLCLWISHAPKASLFLFGNWLWLGGRLVGTLVHLQHGQHSGTHESAPKSQPVFRTQNDFQTEMGRPLEHFEECQGYEFGELRPSLWGRGKRPAMCECKVEPVQGYT